MNTLTIENNLVYFMMSTLDDLYRGGCIVVQFYGNWFRHYTVIITNITSPVIFYKDKDEINEIVKELKSLKMGEIENED